MEASSIAKTVKPSTHKFSHHRAAKLNHASCIGMLFSAEILSIPLFVGFMVVIPFALGSAVRAMMKPARSAGQAWTTFAYVMTFLGWACAFAFGKTSIMSYQASVLLGSVLYVPGTFMLAYFSRRPKQP